MDMLQAAYGMNRLKLAVQTPIGVVIDVWKKM